MTLVVNVDSRHYIMAYELRSNDDVPLDFACGALPDFQAGLFLPRAQPDWFGRSSYPPRLLALAPGGLMMVPHPSAKEAVQTFCFERFCFIESGHMLLRGWLRLVGRDFDRTFFYNTRDWRAVECFLKKLRANFLGGVTNSVQPMSPELGQPLDLKFKYALSGELDPGEAVQTRLFRPAREISRRMLLIKHSCSLPADLIALTTKRVLWITDRDRNGYARYGSIARYAPFSNIARICRAGDGDAHTLRVIFDSCEHQWQIPVAGEHWADAAWFESAPALHGRSGFTAAQPAP